MDEDRQFLGIVGTTQFFYGVDGNEFKLGNVVWEAVEDPNDGYRSLLDCIRVAKSVGIFQSQPLALVKVEEIDKGEMPEDTDRWGYSFDGYALRDARDGHLWLLVGTAEYDDYYPLFVFDYSPKEGNGA